MKETFNTSQVGTVTLSQAHTQLPTHTYVAGERCGRQTNETSSKDMGSEGAAMLFLVSEEEH